MTVDEDDPLPTSDELFVEEPPVPEFLNFLLYGPPGSGKSTGAATAPGPIMWLNAAGPTALAHARKVARRRGTEIHEIRFSKAADPRPKLRGAIEHLRAGEPAVATVVVDTLTRIRKLLVRAMVSSTSDKRRLRELGEVADLLRWFTGELAELPVNVVLVADEAIEDQSGERIVRPLVGGRALVEDILEEIDVIAHCAPYLESDQVRYIANFVETRGRRAKDRSGGLGVMRPIDLSDWREAFRAALDDA